MRVIRCDRCKKTIKGKPIIAGVGLLSTVELCEKCGAPVLKFLRKYKFAETKTESKQKSEY